MNNWAKWDADRVAKGHRIRVKTSYGKNRTTLDEVTKIDPPGRTGRFIVGTQTIAKGTRYERKRVKAVYVGNDDHLERDMDLSYAPVPLKLKNATYPDPESPTLHEQTYDLGKDGSKWAHGYVPLNPAAVALKHHKQPGGDGGSTAKGLASRDSGSAKRAASTTKLQEAAQDRTRRVSNANVAKDEKTVQDHVKLAIGHNEAAKRALDRGDVTTAERHVAKSREHNAAAISAGEAVLGRNASDRAMLEGHAAALQVPIGERTPEQQAAADKALAYAKELRAKRLAAKPPKRKRNTNNGLASTASAAAARRAELDRDKPGFGASSNLRRGR